MNNKTKEKLWGGRFSKPTHQLVEEFNASILVDCQLAQVDIQGSIAHVKMLGHCNILPESDVMQIIHGLEVIGEKIARQEVTFSIADEDIHMNIERLLHEEIGEVAGKLHTGRSRNDQVALDLHLYLRQEILHLLEKISQLQHVLLEQAEQHIDTILPGYTHLQRAQPIRFAHHLLAYFFMLQRDCERLMMSWPRINSMPLGAGALAGSGYPIDRDFVAELLGFDKCYENSMDAVSDRDFIVEFLAHAALIMMHLSRFAEEIILWSSTEFAFIELDDAFCTGSSMMPQKKNPDVAELVRGKTGRVYGALTAMLTILKGLPLTYNKDLQEDKEGLFDTLKTLNHCLSLFAPMIQTMQVNAKNMYRAVTQDYSNATVLADYLTAKNIPFREAHAIVGKIVLYGIEHQQLLVDIPLTQLQQLCSLISEDIYDALFPENAVDSRHSRGGTSKISVVEQLNTARAALQKNIAWATTKVS